ncbi:MAG TPA: hypothetical protein VM198_10940 [Longimicrobiales bacterium]|nr:hypothetical protein [Longimicrobiales bacterium]
MHYLSGNEMRVFPLYYLPLAILAWNAGRTGAAVATLLCGGSWVASNLLAGPEYSLTATWSVNTGMQTLSFATVGLLIAVVRDSFLREQELARTDSLTGLANRKDFYEEAVRLTADALPQEPVHVSASNSVSRLLHHGDPRSGNALLGRSISVPSDHWASGYGATYSNANTRPMRAMSCELRVTSIAPLSRHE